MDLKNELNVEYSIISVNQYGLGYFQAQVYSPERFLEIANNEYECIELENSDDYPFNLVYVDKENGIEFFCMLTQEEFENLKKKGD